MLGAPRRIDDDVNDIALPAVADGTCVRVAAVSSAPVTISVLAAGVAIASDRDAAFALAPLRGPFCPRGGGVVSVRLEHAPSTPVWLQAWATKAPE